MREDDRSEDRLATAVSSAWGGPQSGRHQFANGRRQSECSPSSRKCRADQTGDLWTQWESLALPVRPLLYWWWPADISYYSLLPLNATCSCTIATFANGRSLPPSACVDQHRATDTDTRYSRSRSFLRLILPLFQPVQTCRCGCTAAADTTHCPGLITSHRSTRPFSLAPLDHLRHLSATFLFVPPRLLLAHHGDLRC